MKQKRYCNKFNKDFKNGPGKESLKKKNKQRRGGKDVECIPDNIFKSPIP